MQKLIPYTLATLLCTLAACAGDGSPPSETAPATNTTFELMQRTIFNSQCATGSCHAAGANQGNLILDEARSYAQLVGIAPTNQAAQSRGLQRVVPFDPDRSYLLIKLLGPSSSELGSPMPLGSPPLSAAEINLVRSWIAAGAPGPNSGASPTASLPPVATTTPTETATETPIPSSTASPTTSATPTISATPSMTATGTLPATATASVTATVTPTVTMTATATVPPTPTFNPDATLARLQETLFTPHCAVPFCHEAAVPSGSLVLAPIDVTYSNLVGVQPVAPGAVDRGYLRVDPGNPDNSFLLIKLLLVQFDPELGSPMPLVGDRIPPDQIEHVRAWILRGARLEETQ